MDLGEIRRELERVQRRLEGAQILAADCVLVTSRSAILSRYPRRRLVPTLGPSRTPTAMVFGSGVGDPIQMVDCVEDRQTCGLFFDNDGKPVVNLVGDPICKSSGWRVSHRVEVSGQSVKGVSQAVEWVNSWALQRVDWFREIGIFPKAFRLEPQPLFWADVVLAIAERSKTATLLPTKWTVVLQPYETITLDAWKHRGGREFLKQSGRLPDELEAEIGDDPEDLYAERERFLDDSISTVEALLEMLETPQQQTPPPPSDYVKLWEYANKMWAKGMDKYKICESISNGPGNYSDCVEYLIPNVSRSEQTKRFHSVKGELNKAIQVGLSLEVYRDGQQVLIRKVGEQPTSQRKLKRTATKKKTNTKRKR